MVGNSVLYVSCSGMLCFLLVRNKIVIEGDLRLLSVGQTKRCSEQVLCLHHLVCVRVQKVLDQSEKENQRKKSSNCICILSVYICIWHSGAEHCRQQIKLCSRSGHSSCRYQRCKKQFLPKISIKRDTICENCKYLLFKSFQ